MTNHCTHVIQNFESKNQSVLSRKKEGMVIAVRQAQTVAWGEDPRQQQQRVFTDPKFAQSFLRKLADADQELLIGCKCRCHYDQPEGSAPCKACLQNHEQPIRATLEEVEGESRLMTPSMGVRQ